MVHEGSCKWRVTCNVITKWLPISIAKKPRRLGLPNKTIMGKYIRNKTDMRARAVREVDENVARV